MPGNKKCLPGCTCNHHSAERLKRRSESAKVQAKREGHEKRSAQVGAVWQNRTSEERKRIGAKTVASRGKIRYSQNWGEKIAAGYRNWWDNLPEEQRQHHIMRLVSSRGRRMSELEVTVAGILVSLDISYEFQYVVENYCVDFYVPSLNLLIEVDGTYWHTQPGQPEKDAQRDEYLRAKGYLLTRISEEELKQDALKAVVHAILPKFSV